MKLTAQRLFLLFAATPLLISCAQAQPAPAPTSTVTAPPSLTATITRPPSSTPRPTQTPYLTGTARAILAKTETQMYFDTLKEETQKYYDLGYLTTTDGSYRKYANFSEEWAQLRWYRRWNLNDIASNFYMSAHFKWSSAYRNADVSGCGFAFAIQENGDHYAVFLDRTKIRFLSADQSSSRRLGLTRGTGVVNFNNPADQPVDADFTVIVKDSYVYVLVDGEVVGEYSLSQSRPLRGNLGLTLLSGTNKDFGTRCEMTNVRAWIQKE